MFTQSTFECACKCLQGLNGWDWKEHGRYPGLGFLERTVATKRVGRQATREDQQDSETSEEMEEDPASRPEQVSAAYSLWQSIAFSATFQMPVLYFSVFGTNGVPLPVDGILNTSFVRQEQVRDAVVSPFAVQARKETLPLLSQGDHPTLGTPCWYIHPCASQAALQELVDADDVAGGAENDEDDGFRRLRLWLLLVGNVVNVDGM